MKVLHVTPAFYPAHVYGGPIESVYGLCKGLAARGVDVRVLTTDANGPDTVLMVEKTRDVKLAERLSVRYCRRRIGHAASPALLRFLPAYVRWADVVHLTAAYSFPTIPTLAACRMLGKPIVWSPRGGFQHWQQSRRHLVKMLWRWVCRAIVSKRLVFHVTSEEEAAATRQQFSGFEIVVVPNGIATPDVVTHADGHGVLRLAYLGRIHPIKGIENLLQACHALNAHSGLRWSLTIAGSGEPRYVESIDALIYALGLSRHVEMIGQVSGEAKQRFFEHADICVVPSHTESFGMVVGEALAHGVPVIASKGAPWRRVGEMGCGLWVDNTPESLAKAIEQISRMPLRDMGHKGRLWMAKEFSWEQRASDMMACYTQLAQA